jgi:gamma-glutamylcyclotransferase
MTGLEKRFTTLYLDYSSNLSPINMKQRCPDSFFVGIALLKDYRWNINTTSYAPIIPSPGDIVYGALYFLSGRD